MNTSDLVKSVISAVFNVVKTNVLEKLETELGADSDVMDKVKDILNNISEELPTTVPTTKKRTSGSKKKEKSEEEEDDGEEHLCGYKHIRATKDRQKDQLCDKPAKTKVQINGKTEWRCSRHSKQGTTTSSGKKKKTGSMNIPEPELAPVNSTVSEILKSNTGENMKSFINNLKAKNAPKEEVKEKEVEEPKKEVDSEEEKKPKKEVKKKEVKSDSEDEKPKKEVKKKKEVKSDSEDEKPLKPKEKPKSKKAEKVEEPLSEEEEEKPKQPEEPKKKSGRRTRGKLDFSKYDDQ